MWVVKSVSMILPRCQVFHVLLSLLSLERDPLLKYSDVVRASCYGIIYLYILLLFLLVGSENDVQMAL